MTACVGLRSTTTRFRVKLKTDMGILFGALLLLASSHAGQASPVPPAKLSDELSAWCGHLSHELRSVSLERCLSRTWKIEGQSAKGKPIPSLRWGKEVLDKEGVATKDGAGGQRILVLGAIHGDEISATSMVFRWIDFIEKTKKDSFLRRSEYMFFPLVNPDGFDASPRSRTNAGGVDLNRNFSTSKWDEQAVKFWKNKAGADPRRFPGKKPASEPETQVVERAIQEFKPDLIISVHAPYCLVDHDGPIAFPEAKSPLPVRALGAYPGSLGTYAGVERNIPVVTPELPNAKQMPEVKAVEDLFLFIMRSKF
jgi:hypothetical protein